MASCLKNCHKLAIERCLCFCVGLARSPLPTRFNPTQPNKRASVSKASNTIHSTTQRQTKPTMLRK